MRYLTLFLTIFLLLSSAAINAGTMDPTVPESKYIEYGKKHECVVSMHTVKKMEDKTIRKGFGSAVIVSPTIVITAAHVVVGNDSAEIVLANGERIGIESYVFPKLFITLGMHSNSHDIAVCRLKKSVDIDFYPKLYSEDDEKGKVCSVAGFGFSGKHNHRTLKNDRIKRAGSNIVDSVDDGILICSVGEGVNTSLEFLINSGDSGGGLFIDKKLAAINPSIYRLGHHTTFNYSKHVRISFHKAWIEGIISVLNKMKEIENEQETIQSNIKRSTG